jgi:hypothetical protein
VERLVAERAEKADKAADASASAAGKPSDAQAAKDRIKAITSCEAAKTRTGLANYLALDTDIEPEMAKAIADFQKQQAAMNGERRQIRRALREDIDGLEKKLLTVNLLATPVLVGAFSVWFYRRRKK